jgi:hypothetical protein
MEDGAGVLVCRGCGSRVWWLWGADTAEMAVAHGDVVILHPPSSLSPPCLGGCLFSSECKRPMEGQR